MATTFNVYRDGEKVASGLENKQYTDTGLTPETAYSYQVSAENDGGESDLSNSVEVTTDPEPAEEPESLEVTGQTDTTADLEWQ